MWDVCVCAPLYALAMVHDALQLDSYCNGTEAVPRPDEESLPQVFPPTFESPQEGTSVIVDGTHGSDDNPGL